MNCDYYRVMFHDIVIADHMALDTALILLKALFEKFWNESCQYTIEKESEDDEQ